MAAPGVVQASVVLWYRQSGTAESVPVKCGSGAAVLPCLQSRVFFPWPVSTFVVVIEPAGQRFWFMNEARSSQLRIGADSSAFIPASRFIFPIDPSSINQLHHREQPHHGAHSFHEPAPPCASCCIGPRAFPAPLGDKISSSSHRALCHAAPGFSQPCQDPTDSDTSGASPSLRWSAHWAKP
jgi:hypothetical protein